MRGNRVVQKRGGGKAVLAFFLGILFGIILLVGSVVGAVVYVLSADIDDVLGMFGIDNSADENGDNKYINTDKENGGVETILELITRISAMAGNFKNLTIGQIDALVPATHGLVDQLLEAVSKYVEVDYETLSQQQFSELGDYLKDVVMNIRLSALLAELDLQGDGATNKLLDLLLCGVEANYVTVNDARIPLYYDSFTHNGRYERADEQYLPANLEDYTVAAKDEVTYYVYHYSYNGASYVAQKVDGSYEVTGEEYPLAYSNEYTKCTGNYYYEDGSDERIYVKPITIGSFVNGEGMGALESLPLSELFGTMSSDDEENQKLISAILGELTVGDLMNGTADFYGTIQNIKVGDIIEANGNKILEILSEYTIGGLSEAMDSIVIGDLMDIPASNAIMAYLGYGVTGLNYTEGDPDGSYSAKYSADKNNTVDCTVVVENGNIVSVYYVEDDQTIYCGTAINGISDRLDGVTESLTINEILGNGAHSKILDAIGDYTIGQLSEEDTFNKIEVGALVDISAENKILAYIGYGLTGIEKTGANTYSATYNAIKAGGTAATQSVIVTTDKEGYILSVTDTAGNEVKGTSIGDLDGRISDMTSTVLIKDLIDVGDNTILKKLGEYSLDGIADAMDSFEVAELIDIEAEEASAIMLYLAFGVTKVEYNEAVRLYTAEKDGATVYFRTRTNSEEAECLDSIYSNADLAEGNRLDAVKLPEVGTQLSKLQSEVKIGELIELEGDSPIIELLKDSTLDGVDDLINNLTLPEIMNVNGENAIVAYIAYGITDVNTVDGTAKYRVEGSSEKVDVTLELDENGYITSAYYQDESGETVYLGTEVSKVDKQLDNLTADLTIGEIMDITDDDSAILRAIRHSTINSLSHDIDALTINELYYESIYENPTLKTAVSSDAAEGEINFNSAYIYYEEVNGVYVLVNSDDSNPDNDGKLDELPATGTYYTYGEVNGFWKLLILDDGSERLYTLNSMTAMADNLQDNLMTCSLYDLNRAGVIGDEVVSSLDTTIPDLSGIAHAGDRLGDLTISETIEVIADLMEYINNLGQF